MHFNYIEKVRWSKLSLNILKKPIVGRQVVWQLYDISVWSGSFRFSNSVRIMPAKFHQVSSFAKRLVHIARLSGSQTWLDRVPVNVGKN